MAWEEVASGTELWDAPSYEDRVPEGANAILRLELGSLPAPALVFDLQDKLSFAGVTNVSVVSSGNTIDIHYTKGIAWIPIIIVAIIVLAIVVILWRILVEVPGAGVALPALAIGGLVVAGLLVVAAIKSGRTVRQTIAGR